MQKCNKFYLETSEKVAKSFAELEAIAVVDVISHHLRVEFMLQSFMKRDKFYYEEEIEKYPLKNFVTL